MSRLLCCVVVACFTLTAASDADARRRDRGSERVGAGLRPPGGPLGLGINLGFPTGLSGKYYLTNDQGLAFGLGFGGGGFIAANVDYVWAPTALINIAPGTLYPYIGGGVWVALFPFNYGNFGAPYFVNSPVAIGAELPLGLGWNFAALPLDLYLQVAPALKLFPGLGFGFAGSLGFHYYF